MVQKLVTLIPIIQVSIKKGSITFILTHNEEIMQFSLFLVRIRKSHKFD